MNAHHLPSSTASIVLVAEGAETMKMATLIMMCPARGYHELYPRKSPMKNFELNAVEQWLCSVSNATLVAA